MNDVFALGWPTAPPVAARSEKHIENVHGVVHLAGDSTLLDRLLATPVVEVALLRIRKNFVRLGNGLELKQQQQCLITTCSSNINDHIPRTMPENISGGLGFGVLLGFYNRNGFIGGLNPEAPTNAQATYSNIKCP